MTNRRNPAKKRHSEYLCQKEINAIVDKIVAETLARMDNLDWDPNEPTSDSDTDLSEVSREALLGWFSPPFIAQSYRIAKSPRRTAHRLGGRARSSAPTCGICGKDLVLFADLDGTDRRLRADYPLKRLLLYYCCSCPGPVHYRVTKSGGVKVFQDTREASEEAPFDNPPVSLTRGYLRLDEIDADTLKILQTAESTEGFNSLNRNERKQIAETLGRMPGGRWDCYFSQLGGYPNSFQGGEGVPGMCPNPKCPYRRRRRHEFRFRPLAVLDLWSDTFWGIKPADAVQIVYSICPGCYCIAAKYTCT